MAQRRLRPAEQPPAELLEFNVEEWTAPDDESWHPAFRRWQLARHAWVQTHPDTILGDIIDVLLGETMVRRWRAGTA